MIKVNIRWLIQLVLGAIAGVIIIFAYPHLGIVATSLATGVLFITANYVIDSFLASRNSLSTLTTEINKSCNADLNIDADKYDKNLHELINALNNYGRSIHSLIGRISNRANQVVMVAKDLAIDSETVHNHANLQAQKSHDVETGMQSMSTTMKDVAQNATDTFNQIKEISSANDIGLQNMSSMQNHVSNISDLFQRVSQTMEDLQHASDEIGNVIAIIKGITEQTNLLALNAAIEAARAGEHGRGFAVVADEVRQLAEITRKSTEEISETIDRNQSLTNDVSEAMTEGEETVKDSVEQAEKAKEALTIVANSINHITSMIQQIADATNQQSDVVVSAANNIKDIAILADESKQKASSSYKASEGMDSISRNLENEVNKFDLNFFGLVPLQGALIMNESFTPLCEYLSQVLGKELNIRLGHDYDDAIHDLGTGRALISYQTPSTYIEAKNKHQVELLAVPLDKGAPFYKSAVIVAESSGINSIKELRDKKFAFGDPKSTGSKAMPEAMLKNAGVGIHDLAEHAFLGSHDNVANAVLKGDYDGGGLMESVAQNYVDQGIKILEISGQIPQFPICAPTSMDKETRDKITKALVDLKDENILKTMGKNITGFTQLSDTDYDSVREMLRQLG